jgi:hypothetical protein
MSKSNALIGAKQAIYYPSMSHLRLIRHLGSSFTNKVGSYSPIGTGRILVPTKWPMWANTVAVPTHFVSLIPFLFVESNQI